jgi:glycine/D-amino acid oxidase-like deaminating enzyme/nitrite reductase/ring-hydroxylating ferredoxin subunit
MARTDTGGPAERAGASPIDGGATVSAWHATKAPFETTPLRGNARADACVVGAGIAGLSTAYLLSLEGKRVVVLDDGPVGGGETGRTTAHLSFALDDRFHRLEQMHGAEGARLAAESHAAAVARIETTAARERIDCGFERLDGFLFEPRGSDGEELEREIEAARRAGVPGVERVPRAPLASFDTGPALRFPNQGQFHPLRYLAGLREAIERRGGAVHTGSRVEEVHEGAPCRVVVAGGREVLATDVVVATNTPFVDRVAIHTKQAPYRTFAVALRIAKGVVPRVLLWDTADPYHYVRLHSEGTSDLLIVGGEDHKTGQADDGEARLRRLVDWARDRFPAAGDVANRWSGQVLEPVDSLAFLGRNPGSEHLYVITGDSGQGMTHATIGAMVVTDLVRGRENPWATLYDPSRKSVAAAGEFLKENLNVAARYGEHLTAGEVEDEGKIAPGEGAVVRRGLRKHAVLRDEAGKVHRLSAVCPHLGCLVHWNGLEKTWDCPCHGSRFDARGGVLNGPANRGLAPVEDD